MCASKKLKRCFQWLCNYHMVDSPSDLRSCHWVNMIWMKRLTCEHCQWFTVTEKWSTMRPQRRGGAGLVQAVTQPKAFWVSVTVGTVDVNDKVTKSVLFFRLTENVTEASADKQNAPHGPFHIWLDRPRLEEWKGSGERAGSTSPADPIQLCALTPFIIPPRAAIVSVLWMSRRQSPD